jgi:TPR repeat protein
MVGGVIVRRTLLALAVSVVMTGGALAGPLEDGQAAYLRGDYATALRVWLPLAQRGNVVAQVNVGSIYDTGGRGVPSDLVEAVRWYHRAAEGGSATAQNNLGTMYFAGRGTLQDDAEAVRWWRNAAEQGLAAAQFNLGRSLANGRGVPQNFVEAYMWLSLAAARLPPGRVSELAVSGRDAVRASMTPRQIAEAQRLAREWDAAHPAAR